VFRDFYATAAQVLPVLMLAFVWESRFLERLRAERRPTRRVDPSGVLFWTKPRVRVYSLFVAIVIIGGTGVAVLALAGLLPDSAGLRAVITGCVLVALATLLFRISVDVLVATRDHPQPDTDERR
jgi:hypothetical protein